MGLTRKYELEHIGRPQSRWKDVFDTIDSNFDKIDEFLNDISTRIHITHIIADDEQTYFTLDDVYMTDTNSLVIYRNGVRQFVDIDYKEREPNTFEMLKPCDAGDRIDAVYNEFYLPEDESSLEVQIFNVLTSLKQSVYGDEYETLDEALEASIAHAKDSIEELDQELIEEVRAKAQEIVPLQERLSDIVNRLSTGQFFDGVEMVWFTPHVSAEGVISWTNNGGLENPKPVKLVFDIMIPEGTVAIGSSKGGYTYTNPAQYGVLQRSKPGLGDKNPVPHFGVLPLEYGGLGPNTDISKLKGYNGPLQYNTKDMKFDTIEGTGVLIRDEQGVRFGVVPVEYGGTGTTSLEPAMISNEPSNISLLSTRSASPIYSIALSDKSLDNVSWHEISSASRKAIENPGEYRSWIGRSKSFTLNGKDFVPETIESEKEIIDLTSDDREYDFSAQVKATIVGIKTDSIGDNDYTGFIFAIMPLLGCYTENDVSSDGNYSDNSIIPQSREKNLTVYENLLPEDLRENLKPVIKVDYDPVRNESIGHKYKLFIPSLSELNLYQDVVDTYSNDYEIGKETSRCYEYYATPRDYFFDKIILGNDQGSLSKDERYVLRSTAAIRVDLVEARNRLRQFIKSSSEIVNMVSQYDLEELKTLSTLVDKCELLLDDKSVSSNEINDLIDDVQYFIDSMIPNLDAISWDDMFDLIYELRYKAQTIVDTGDNQLDRIVGKSKSVTTETFGRIAFEVIDNSSNDSEEKVITLAPKGQAIFFSRMKDFDSNDGGYNLADVMKNNLNLLRSELPDELKKYLFIDKVYYDTPEGYTSWIDSSIRIPSMDDIEKYGYFNDSKRIMSHNDEPTAYWTREIDING